MRCRSNRVSQIVQGSFHLIISVLVLRNMRQVKFVNVSCTSNSSLINEEGELIFESLCEFSYDSDKADARYVPSFFSSPSN